MQIMFLDAPYAGKVELNEETINYLKNYKKVALYASVQFINNLEKIKQQLNENDIQIITSKPKRAHVEGQLLGCDCSADSLNLTEEVDCFLYIGDGKFHPLALVHAQDNEVVCFDPIGEKMTVLSQDIIEKINKRRRGALAKFYSSDNIGVIISVKPGQEQLKPSLILKNKYPNKKFYYFIDNNVSFSQLENFNFIDVWVNTACPRIGLDDQEMFREGVVNLKDVLSPQ